MPRNVAIQVLRGVLANAPSLDDGEFYFATDTLQLFMGLSGGTVGIQIMALQIQDPNTLTNVVAVQPKGTQGTFFLSVQDAKDSGRILKVFSTTLTAVATTETLASLTPLSESPSGTLVTGTAATNFTVTAGKRFRIQSIQVVATNITAAAAVGARAALRVANNTAVTTSSPILLSVGAVTTTALLGESAGNVAAIPDGLELSGTENFGVTYFASSVDAQVVVVLVGFEY